VSRGLTYCERDYLDRVASDDHQADVRIWVQAASRRSRRTKAARVVSALACWTRDNAPAKLAGTTGPRCWQYGQPPRLRNTK
jgi:hypothetical protein